jgi:hypothetical protein
MDRRERILMAQFDGPSADKALKEMQAHWAATGRNGRQVVFEDENSVPAQTHADLQKKHTRLQVEHAQQSAYCVALKLQNQQARARLKWKRVSRRRKVVIAAAAVACLAAYWEREWLWVRWSPAAAEQQAALSKVARAQVTAVNWGKGWSHAFVFAAAGVDYWGMMEGVEVTTRDVDAQAHPIVVTCLDLYGAPAQADTEAPRQAAYFEPHPFGLFGRLTWPELAVDCKVAGLVQKEASK